MKKSEFDALPVSTQVILRKETVVFHHTQERPEGLYEVYVAMNGENAFKYMEAQKNGEEPNPLDYGVMFDYDGEEEGPNPPAD